MPWIARAIVRPRDHGLLAGRSDGILQVVIGADRRRPEIAGNLARRLQPRRAGRRAFKALTDSDIAFAADGEVLAATLPESTWPTLA